MNIKELKIERIKIRATNPLRSRALEGLIAGSSAIAKKENREVTDKDIVMYAKSTIKSLQKAMNSFDQSYPLYSEYQSEITVLEEFLPVMISESTIVAKIDKLIEALPASNRSMRSMGSIIGSIKGAYGDSVDMALVSTLVKKKLATN